MTNDRFRIHLTSGNSLHRNRQEAAGRNGRRQLLQYAIFYSVVAAILLITNQSSQSPVTDAIQSTVRSESRFTGPSYRGKRDIQLFRQVFVGPSLQS